MNSQERRFVAERGFAGSDGDARRSGPVEFSRDQEKEEEDLFGVSGCVAILFISISNISYS